MPDQSKRPNQIFICYRREDTAGVVGRIYDRLVQRFGKDAIFKDVDSLPLGRDFRRHIDSVVSECCVALVVVGDRWIGASGASRLDDPRDYVRIEIESALKRDIPVIPLLVQNAELPADERLPDSLKDFAYRNGMTIGHDPHFHSDVDRLIKHLEDLIADRREEEMTESAPTPATIPAPEQVVSTDRERTSDIHPQAVQVSGEQEHPPIASAEEEASQTAAAASPPEKTETDLWIAAKDRGRIVLLYLSLWLGVGVANTLVYAFLGQHLPITGDKGHLTYYGFLIVPLMSLLFASGQIIILKGYIGPARRGIAQRWSGYTLAASVVSNLLRLALSPDYSLPDVTLLYDVPRAAFQWLVLRTEVRRASLWIVANLAAGILYTLAASPSYRSGWTGAQILLMMSLRTSLTATAEILCLVTFRRKG
jgi:hypothetical protein